VCLASGQSLAPWLAPERSSQRTPQAHRGAPRERSRGPRGERRRGPAVSEGADPWAPKWEMAPRGKPAHGRTEAGSPATIPRSRKTDSAPRARRLTRREPPSPAVGGRTKSVQRPSPTLTPLRGEAERPARAERSGAPRLDRESPRRQRERERERERRVSDADASYKGPAASTTTLTCAIPQEKHANNNPLCCDPVPLHGPVPKRLKSTTKPTQTQPYVYPDSPVVVRTLVILYSIHT
jgi:hypothetical protein